jgi:molybdate transport system substrate-binding protein
MNVRLAALAVATVVAGCGSSTDPGDGPLTIFAAASLSDVLEPLAPDGRFNFAGSDELATQIREGAEPDVFAAASTRYPDELHGEGLVERPRVFATNRLVLIASDTSIRSVADLARPGVKLVVAAEGVPVGDYTRNALTRLGEQRVLKNVVSEEEEVKGVLGKVQLGEADAGFVYATDVARKRPARVVELPASAQPRIEYSVAVIRASQRRREAQRFVEALLGAKGRRLLAGAGFGIP